MPLFLSSFPVRRASRAATHLWKPPEKPTIYCHEQDEWLLHLYQTELFETGFCLISTSRQQHPSPLQAQFGTVTFTDAHLLLSRPLISWAVAA